MHRLMMMLMISFSNLPEMERLALFAQCSFMFTFRAVCPSVHLKSYHFPPLPSREWKVHTVHTEKTATESHSIIISHVLVQFLPLIVSLNDHDHHYKTIGKKNECWSSNTYMWNNLFAFEMTISLQSIKRKCTQQFVCTVKSRELLLCLHII